MYVNASYINKKKSGDRCGMRCNNIFSSDSRKGITLLKYIFVCTWSIPQSIIIKLTFYQDDSLPTNSLVSPSRSARKHHSLAFHIPSAETDMHNLIQGLELRVVIVYAHGRRLCSNWF